IDIERISGSPDVEYGVIFRYFSDDSYYTFMLNDSSQTFSVWINRNGEWYSLHDWSYNRSIQANAVNRLGISARGSRFVFFINGENVSTRSGTGPLSGRIGVTISAPNTGDSAVLRFANLELQGSR
ncbi:MAG: hypothetical protein JXB85_18175, partial [Anaerolineales bacterium]|nr:hypothetical protein [Anaerolineales bacterium]